MLAGVLGRTDLDFANVKGVREALDYRDTHSSKKAVLISHLLPCLPLMQP